VAHETQGYQAPVDTIDTKVFRQVVSQVLLLRSVSCVETRREPYQIEILNVFDMQVNVQAIWHACNVGELHTVETAKVKVPSMMRVLLASVALLRNQPRWTV
jgi:hypothetical protein